MAARRRWSVRAGHDAPERAFITPAPAHTQPSTHLLRLGPLRRLAAPAAFPQLRRRHSCAQLMPSHSRTTAIPPPCPQHPVASSRARHSRSVSVSAVQRLTGAPPRTPSSWPRCHSPPPSLLASVLGSPAFLDARLHFRLGRRGRRQRTADVPPRRAAMAAAVVAGVDDRAGQVYQSTR